MKRLFLLSLFSILSCGLFAATAQAQNPLKLLEAFQQKQKQANPAAAENAADESIPELTLPAPKAADAPVPVDDPFDIDVAPAEKVEELAAPKPSESKPSEPKLSEPKLSESKNSKSNRPTPRQTDQQDPNASPSADMSNAFLGATIEKATQGQLGVKVKDVLADSPAEAAGIQVGDRLISIAGSPITSEKDLQELQKVLAPGDRIELEFMRGLRKSKTIATLSANVAQASGELALSSPTGGQPETIAPQSVTRPFDVIPVPADDRFDPRIGNQISPPKLGLQVIDVVEETGIGLRKRVRSGAGVQTIAANSPAATAGIPVGALIVGANGRRIGKAADLSGFVSTLKPGQVVELTYYDGNRLKRSKIELAGDGVQPAANFQPVPGYEPADDETARPILKGLGQQFPALRRVDNLLDRFSPKPDGAAEPEGAATRQDAPVGGLGALREKLRIQQDRNRPLFPRGR